MRRNYCYNDMFNKKNPKTNALKLNGQMQLHQDISA